MSKPIYSKNINRIFNLGISPLLADKHGGECVIVSEYECCLSILAELTELVKKLEISPEAHIFNGEENTLCTMTLTGSTVVNIHLIGPQYELDNLTPDTVVYHCDKSSLDPVLQTRLDAYVNAKATIRKLATRYGM